MRRRTLARDNASTSPPRLRRHRSIGAALFLLLAFAVGLSCGGGSSRPSSTSTPAATAPFSTSNSDQPAQRDLVDLAQRLQGAVSPARSVQLPPLNVGDVQQLDLAQLPSDPAQPPTTEYISATVRAVSDHAYFLFEDGGPGIDDNEVQAAVSSFESTIWPQTTGVFGLPAIPGVDGDPRIVVLHADLGASAGGYVNGDDAYPRSVVPHSNQREILYINVSVRPLGSAEYEHVVAHELQHLIHRAHNGDAETWLNEGLSEYAGDLVGGPTQYESFLKEPDTQLTAWPDGSNAHYGASALFVDYLAGQGATDVGRLASEPGFGTEGVRTFLRDSGLPLSLEDVTANWAVANLLDEPSGPYSYPTRSVGPAATKKVESTGVVAGDVHQFGTDYLEFDAGHFSRPVSASFSGDTQVPVIAGQAAAQGGFWYSGGGDNIDGTLTRQIDLSKVDKATLTFRTWFDTEHSFDWGYTEISKDSGKTWQVLAGAQTSTDDPLGVAYGPGYSGTSGAGAEPAWVDERMDLTPFAGSKVLLRFELINDDGTSLPGWAVDDIAVPEIGFSDSAASDDGWRRQGFQRVEKELPQRFALRFVTYGTSTEVQAITPDAQNHATIDLSGLGTDYQKAVLVVLGETDGTMEPAHYRYDVEEGAP
jgi:immune inhibitor A